MDFNFIPENIRIPKVLIEFNENLSASTKQVLNACVWGQRLATGTVAAGEARRITNAAQAEEYWGRGSQIAEMFRVIKAVNPFFETWGIALDDDVAGVAGTQTMTFTGSATEAGTHVAYIGGRRYKIGVASGDTQDVQATAAADVINADGRRSVDAAVDGVNANQINLVARHDGETGNSIDLRMNYYGEKTPAGTAVAFGAATMTGGTTNPDVTDAINAMGSDWYNYIIHPYTDAANLTIIETQLELNYQPPRQQGSRSFTAHRGTHTSSTTYGNGRNSGHVTSFGTMISPAPVWIWAAMCGIISADSLAKHPAKQMNGLKVPAVEGYVLAPKPIDRWTEEENNLALFDGISTSTVGADGEVYLQWVITMYQKNTAGIEDDALLLVNDVELRERVRFEKIATFAPYARHLLAEDNARPAPGVEMIQPKSALVVMLNLYRNQEAKGWVQDYEGYKATALAAIDADVKTRLNIADQPKHVRPLGVLAINTQTRR